MNEQWRSFLESRSAQIDDTGQVSFEGGDKLSDCNIFDLSHLRLTSISGTDAETFLQGQVTNDVKQVSSSAHQMSGFCTPKGRMLANFRLFKQGDAYIAQTPADTQPSLLKRLAMFVMRSQVVIEDVSDQFVAIGMSGECCVSLLESFFEQIPTNMGEAVEHNGITLLCISEPIPRFMLIGEPEAIVPIWEKSTSQSVESNPDTWKLLDIRSGIPTVYAETVESFIPQMVNMQLVNGISFDKGCYVGQEVVARMKYLGVLKRHMHLARVDTETRPEPGEQLFSNEDKESGQGAGNIVMSAPSDDGGFELLAVVENSSFEEGDLYIGSPSGPKLNFLPMPYDFE